MKKIGVGWAFFIFAVIAAIGSLLTVGVYIGSELEVTPDKAGVFKFDYATNCRYLYLSGIREVWDGGETGTLGLNNGNGRKGFCPVLGILAR